MKCNHSHTQRQSFPCQSNTNEVACTNVCKEALRLCSDEHQKARILCQPLMPARYNKLWYNIRALWGKIQIAYAGQEQVIQHIRTVTRVQLRFPFQIQIRQSRGRVDEFQTVSNFGQEPARSHTQKGVNITLQPLQDSTHTDESPLLRHIVWQHGKGHSQHPQQSIFSLF